MADLSEMHRRLATVVALLILALFVGTVGYSLAKVGPLSTPST